MIYKMTLYTIEENYDAKNIAIFCDTQIKKDASEFRKLGARWRTKTKMEDKSAWLAEKRHLPKLTDLVNSLNSNVSQKSPLTKMKENARGRKTQKVYRRAISESEGESESEPQEENESENGVEEESENESENGVEEEEESESEPQDSPPKKQPVFYKKKESPPKKQPVFYKKKESPPKKQPEEKKESPPKKQPKEKKNRHHRRSYDSESGSESENKVEEKPKTVYKYDKYRKLASRKPVVVSDESTSEEESSDEFPSPSPVRRDEYSQIVKKMRELERKLKQRG
jgi:hypothetical protein